MEKASGFGTVGDVLLLAAGPKETLLTALGQLRLELAQRLSLIPSDGFKLLWVYDFPLFEKDPESGRLVSCHHPFTAPRAQDLPLLKRSRKGFGFGL